MQLPVVLVVGYSAVKKMNRKGMVIAITRIIVKHNPPKHINNHLRLIFDELCFPTK